MNQSQFLICLTLLFAYPNVFSAVTFGRDKLKGTTRTMSLVADDKMGVQVEKRVRSDFTGSFSVEVDGVVVEQVIHIDGMAHSYDEGGKNDGIADQAKPGTIFLQRKWTNLQDWSNWRKSVLDGKVDRKSISVIFHNDAGEEAGRVNFYDCFPTKWVGPALNAKNSGHATEKIELAFERMEWKQN